MELFQQMAEMGHERVLFGSSPETGMQAIIAVHSTCSARACGRQMWHYNHDEEFTESPPLPEYYKAAAAASNSAAARRSRRDHRKTRTRRSCSASASAAVHERPIHTAEDVGTGRDAGVLSPRPLVTGSRHTRAAAATSPVTAVACYRGGRPR